PEQAMKKLVWSETNVTGPGRFHAKLPMPPTNNGPIRNLARGGRGSTDPAFYGDTAMNASRAVRLNASLSSGTISPWSPRRVRS
ncbi:MAG: glycosyl hydrolase, partial [Verrucomicrobiales bacterium]|nr:glycosyl hydrolase [Verrucomicrobiales bacterium]